jgi:hypothetical protein
VGLSEMEEGRTGPSHWRRLGQVGKKGEDGEWAY